MKKGTKHSEGTKKKMSGRVPWSKGLTKDTDERLKKIGELFTGKNNPMYGKKHSVEVIKKISGENHHMYGKKHSEESKRKMSESRKGKKKPPFTEEHKTKISKSKKGKKMSKEFKEKCRKRQLGKKYSEATKKKMSESGKGIIPSIESRKKMSESSKGKKHTKKTKIKLSKLRKGQKKPPFSDEHKRNLSESMKGKVSPRKGKILLEESKKKISATKQGIDIKDWEKFVGCEPYDQGWTNQFKKLIRNRDNNVCMLCNTHRDKLRKALDVHHIDYDKLNSTKENCISLCHSCHGKTGTNRKYWIIFFQALLKEKYGYQY